MKPFDLEAAKRGEPIQTIRGEPRRFLLHDPALKEDSRVIIANKNGEVLRHCEDGKYVKDQDYPAFDLCMAPRKRQMWARMFRWKDSGVVFLRNDVASNKAHLVDSPSNTEWLGPAVLVAEWDCDDTSTEVAT